MTVDSRYPKFVPLAVEVNSKKRDNAGEGGIPLKEAFPCAEVIIRVYNSDHVSSAWFSIWALIVDEKPMNSLRVFTV